MLTHTEWQPSEALKELRRVNINCAIEASQETNRRVAAHRLAADERLRQGVVQREIRVQDCRREHAEDLRAHRKRRAARAAAVTLSHDGVAMRDDVVRTSPHVFTNRYGETVSVRFDEDAMDRNPGGHGPM